MPKVRFVGGTGDQKDTGHVVVDGKTLYLNQDVNVSDELAQELLAGDEKRLKGLKFESGDDDGEGSEAPQPGEGEAQAQPESKPSVLKPGGTTRRT